MKISECKSHDTPKQLDHRAAGARRRKQCPCSYHDYRRAGTVMSAETNRSHEFYINGRFFHTSGCFVLFLRFKLKLASLLINIYSLADWFWCRGEPFGTCKLDSQLRLFLTGSGTCAAMDERVRLGRLRRNFSATERDRNGARAK